MSFLWSSDYPLEQHVNDQMYTYLVAATSRSDYIRSHRHAAAIVYKDNVIATGNNLLKTHPIMLKWGKNPESLFLHAEMDAIVRGIRAVGEDIFPYCTMYVLRKTRGGKVGNSCPCEGCRRAITSFGFKEVYWS
jgi:deoxycytidylate deaminase